LIGTAESVNVAAVVGANNLHVLSSSRPFFSSQRLIWYRKYCPQGSATVIANDTPDVCVSAVIVGTGFVHATTSQSRVIVRLGTFAVIGCETIAALQVVGCVAAVGVAIND
jgi:hypothetical protein